MMNTCYSLYINCIFSIFITFNFHKIYIANIANIIFLEMTLLCIFYQFNWSKNKLFNQRIKITKINLILLILNLLHPIIQRPPKFSFHWPMKNQNRIKNRFLIPIIYIILHFSHQWYFRSVNSIANELPDDDRVPTVVRTTWCGQSEVTEEVMTAIVR